MDPYSAQVMMLNQLDLLSGEFRDRFIAWFLALVLLLAGFLLALLAERLAPIILRWVRWDALCQTLGVTRIIQKVRSDLSASQTTSKAVFYFVLLTVGMKALAIAKLGWLSEWGQRYFDILPSLIQAIVIVLVANFIALICAQAIRYSFTHPLAVLSGELTRQLIFSLGAYMALLRLGFERDLVLATVLIVLAGHVLAFALAWAREGQRPFVGLVRINEPEEGV